MALNWQISKCKELELIKAKTPEGWPLTEYLILTLGVVGAGSITEKNWSELYARYRLYWSLDGDEPKMTAYQFYLRVGLETNWQFKDDSRVAFLKRVGGNFLNTFQREADRATS